MQFKDNDITLTRRERKALGAPSRHISAFVVGHLWREATAVVEARRERLGPGISAIDVIPGLGAVASHSAEHYELQRLDKQQRRLDGMEHAALAIEAETMPPSQCS